MPKPQAHPTPRQQGTGLVEAILLIIPVLLLGTLGVELARGYQVKQLMLLALQEAGRVAAVHQGNHAAWQPTLTRGLSRIYIPAGRYANPQARLKAERERFQQKFSLPLWQATVTSPSRDTLHLKLTYLHAPMQDWLRTTLGLIVRASRRWQTGAAGKPNDFALRAWRQGLIPIVVEYKTLKHRSLSPSSQ